MAANIFTLPPGVPFLKAVARAILNGDLPAANGTAPDLIKLPNITLLLPTRRASRAAREAFLSVADASAIIMPRIRPISEGDDDRSLISSLSGDGLSGFAALDQPPAIDPLDRTLVLMQLISHWRATTAQSDADRSSGSTPSQAARLAAELGKLMDDIERENVSLSGIQNLVPETYAEHWQKTVDFLKIVTEFWPAYLEANGMTSPEARRNALILAEAERISKLEPDEIVIVAGITGSIPATVELMRAVAARSSGAIVLPALDHTLDDASWSGIVRDHPEHPQFGLKKLLDALGVERGAVLTLPGLASDAADRTRAAFVSEAMRPSSSTDQWHRYATTADKDQLGRGLAGISLIEAPSAQDEAETVALILREAIETPGQTAALVSPDRVLARRVAIRLEAWGIRVDDSAGRPFAKTVPGAFLALVVGAIVSDFSPAETMALLRHPLCRLRFTPFDIRKFARALEISAFRTSYLGHGLEGVRAAFETAERDRAEKKRMHSAARRLWPDDCDGARELITRLAAAFQPLSDLYAASGDLPLSAFARAHAEAAEALATLPEDDASSDASVNPLWQGEAGETASRFFAKLLDDATPPVEIRAADYADLYAMLLARENVRERTAVHPRISIWGPFEARLQQPDVLVLGSLNEGTWPEAAEPGAWLNRPMRRDLGLPSPEEEIGRAAHDFTSLLGAKTIYLTRAEKVDGVPTVPSRWLMRMRALLKGMNLEAVFDADKPWLAWARARDHIAGKRTTIKPPEPRPALALRPRRMSVTDIERWIANPYATYARHILKLEPLPPLGASPDASLRGALVHDVLSRFANAFPNCLPDNPLAELEKIASDVLHSYTGNARIAAFWMPRLKRFLSWFAEGEDKRRDGVRNVIAEISGSLVLAPTPEPFTLTARADRIDDTGSALVITDYKTGAIPKQEWVVDGRSPQLPLEAAIALGDTGFPNLAGRTVEALRYIRASGGEPAGEERAIKSDDIAALANKARTGLERLIAEFDNPATPYRALRRPSYSYDYDAYAQLARVAEWSAHVDEEAAQ
ncbi:MAG: double-strand break repair protein AddB [Hyphomicrobium sp.]|uniref:double-strand break repair protein AddB n=1 Tax=Hyphomicrobium sp. TaxID=82 RepID=UPI003561EDFC